MNVRGYGMYHEARKTGKKIQQSLIRLREEDHAEFKKALERDDLSMQKFYSFCVESYLRSDPEMLQLVVKWKNKMFEERRNLKGNLGMINDKDREKLYEMIESPVEETVDEE